MSYDRCSLQVPANNLATLEESSQIVKVGTPEKGSKLLLSLFTAFNNTEFLLSQLSLMMSFNSKA